MSKNVTNDGKNKMPLTLLRPPTRVRIPAEIVGAGTIVPCMLACTARPWRQPRPLEGSTQPSHYHLQSQRLGRAMGEVLAFFKILPVGISQDGATGELSMVDIIGERIFVLHQEYPPY